MLREMFARNARRMVCHKENTIMGIILGIGRRALLSRFCCKSRYIFGFSVCVLNYGDFLLSGF